MMMAAEIQIVFNYRKKESNNRVPNNQIKFSFEISRLLFLPSTPPVVLVKSTSYVFCFLVV